MTYFLTADRPIEKTIGTGEAGGRDLCPLSLDVPDRSAQHSGSAKCLNALCIGFEAVSSDVQSEKYGITANKNRLVATLVRSRNIPKYLLCYISRAHFRATFGVQISPLVFAAD